MTETLPPSPAPIEDKSPELVQAQVAAFTAERVGDYEDRKHMYNNLGAIALGGVEDVQRVQQGVEYSIGETGRPVRMPAGTKRTVATAEQYTDFLRSVGGSRYEGIAGRAELLTAYHDYAPTIARLKDELADPATRKEHPNYLGSGLNTTVFSMEHGDRRYAVRVPHGASTDPTEIDMHLGGAVLGRGVSHLEQIVAASYEDGVTVAEMMPGKEMGNLEVSEIAQVTDTQLGELVDTIITANGRGISFDPKPSNLLYDVEHGYGIVDYSASKRAGKDGLGQDLGAIVSQMGAAIMNAGFYGRPETVRKTAEDYGREWAYTKANYGVLQRYRTAVVEKLSGEDRMTALKAIDADLEACKDVLSPNWVAEQVERDRLKESQKPEPVVVREQSQAAADRLQLEDDFVA